VRKSQIAIEYAYRLSEQSPDRSVFWVHGGSVDGFLQSLHQILRECNIPEPDDPKADRAALVKEWLKGKECGQWLLIIDNADDTELFFPSQKGMPRQLELLSNSTSGSGVGLATYIPECS